MDIEGLGDKLVDQLVDGGLIRTLPDLYKLGVGQARGAGAHGRQERRSNLVAALETSKQTTLARFLYALGIRHVGETHRARTWRGTSASSTAIMDASVEQLLEVTDVGPVVAQSIHTFFDQPHNREVVEQLRAGRRRLGRARRHGRRARRKPLAGKTFVLTGTLPTLSRDEAKDADRGGRRQGGRLGVEEDRLRRRRRRGRQQARQGAGARRRGARRSRLAQAAARRQMRGTTSTHERPTMAVREILKMGDPRLLRVAQPVREFDTPRAARADRRHVRHHGRPPTAPAWRRRRSASTCSW